MPKPVLPGPEALGKGLANYAHWTPLTKAVSEVTGEGERI